METPGDGYHQPLSEDTSSLQHTTSEAPRGVLSQDWVLMVKTNSTLHFCSDKNKYLYQYSLIDQFQRIMGYRAPTNLTEFLKKIQNHS